MNQPRNNWPTGSRFSARLVAVERLLLQRNAAAALRNSRFLDLIEACIVIDVWDGGLHPDQVEIRLGRDMEGIGVRPDASIPQRIARLREQARRTYTPPN